jgi:prepilin-type N-terminal cleavage/methylation domain-containing protein
MSMTRREIGADARRGFTLIELLVVLIIIAVIISIVLPALGHVRKFARAGATKAEITKINNATMVFNNDNKRMPGYFTAREMASTANETAQGLSAMQNVILDLAGFGAGTLQIGPVTGQELSIDPALIGAQQGANNKLYYAPEGKNFVAQTDTGQQVSGNPNHMTMPSLVDAFGNPYLAWVADDTAVGTIDTIDKFAKQRINSQNDKSAKFYWAPNACFLKATALGRRAYDQTSATEGSLIGGAPTTPPTDIDKSIAGFLGNPSFPYKSSGAITNPAIPASARAPFIVHSTGADGIFLGRKDRGAKQFGTTFIDYTANFLTPITNQTYTDKDGKPTNIDLLEKFDDIIGGAGN